MSRTRRRPTMKYWLVKEIPLLEVGDLIMISHLVQWKDAPLDSILIHRVVRRNHDYFIWDYISKNKQLSRGN